MHCIYAVDDRRFYECCASASDDLPVVKNLPILLAGVENHRVGWQQGFFANSHRVANYLHGGLLVGNAFKFDKKIDCGALALSWNKLNTVNKV